MTVIPPPNPSQTTAKNDPPSEGVGGGDPRPETGPADQSTNHGTSPPGTSNSPSPGGDPAQDPPPLSGEDASSGMDLDPTGDGEHATSADEAVLLLKSFPVAKLNKLEELINNPRWIIPVLPGAELEVLLETAISLARHPDGLDRQSLPCQRFYREGLVVSFNKLMTDDAVTSWRQDIHKCIYKNCERMLELCVVKLLDETFPLFDLLALVLNPHNKFHQFNSPRPSEVLFPNAAQAEPAPNDDGEEDGLSADASPAPAPAPQHFARPIDVRHPMGWLVDLLNHFGELGGFERLLERFRDEKGLTVSLIHALVRPFGQCHELLTRRSITTYLMPIVENVPKFLENLNDDELKKETKTESTLSGIIKALKQLASEVPNQEENIRQLEMFRLKMILRQLQVSSFGGKMAALNEVNRVITTVSYYPQRHSNTVSSAGGGSGGGVAPGNGDDDEDFLTNDRMATWLKENKVLQIVLQDSLHQPQYVEKLEKVIRFSIKEKALSLSDLDDIWAAQVGQHEAIVKNVHDLLAKLAWDFSSDQLDHLFECFQSSWSSATKKQREKLLQLIRRLAEDDKDGVMAEKVLSLFWSLAHNPDTTSELLDQALSAHIKILDYSCAQYREKQKIRWLEKCIDELKNSRTWVIPALKQIRDICCLYQEMPPNVGQHGAQQRTAAASGSYRSDVINRLQSDHALVILVADNLTTYIEEVRHCPQKVLEADPAEYCPDGRYNHICQVQERLSFLRFLLKDGQLWLCAPQAKQIWNCLAENAVFEQDREACFKWFCKLMGDEPDLDPDINRDFFENNILQLDPSLMTESGIKCFDRFFKAVNAKENKLIPKRRAHLMNDLELIGLDYIWRLILCSNEDIANRAIELLKETFTNLGPRLQANQVDIHEDFISSCMDRLKAAYDTVSLLERVKDAAKLQQEFTKLCRVLKVLHEYVMECDADFVEERCLVPLFRASRGKQKLVTVRFPNQGRQVDDLEVWTHANETLGSVRRQILQRLKVNPANVRLEMFFNGDIIDCVDDRRTLLSLGFKEKTLLTGKLSQVGGAGAVGTAGAGGAGAAGTLISSPDSSSDSSTSSPRHHHFDGGPNLEMEQCLPGVIMSNQKNYCHFLLQLSDLGAKLQHPALQEAARVLLKLIPADVHTMNKLRSHCQEQLNLSAAGKSKTLRSPVQIWDGIFFTPSPSQTLYNLEVCYSLLMPSAQADKTFEFQQAFVQAKGIPAVISMLTRNNFVSSANVVIKRAAYTTLMRMCKLLFSTAGYSLVQMVAEACQPDSATPVSSSVHNQAVVLQQALHQIPSPSVESMVRSMSQRLAQHLVEQGAAHMPDHDTVLAIIRLAWVASKSVLDRIEEDLRDLVPLDMGKSPAAVVSDDAKTPEKEEDVQLCREALEVLSLAVALYPNCLESLNKEKWWHNFIIQLVLVNGDARIRQTAAEQFILIATRCSADHQPLRFFTTLLFTMLATSVPLHAQQCSEYFLLLSRLLSFTAVTNVPLSQAESLLNGEITWLKKIRENVRKSGVTGCDDNLLEGHLSVCRELLAFMSPEKKFEIGSNNKAGVNLVRDLVDDFIFPASRMIVIHRQTGEIPMGQAQPVCPSGPTLMAAFDLLVGLCTGCAQNLKLVASILTEMFYSDKEDVQYEWEYLPPVGPRPNNGFVGLKNAGATCYMNSVLQQLYMIEAIRNGILSAEGACNDSEEDFSGEDREDDLNDNEVIDDSEQNRREYNITILKQVQAIFAHLSQTRLQFYVPRGLWKHFRMLQGEPVNLREQQDAVEFFMRLIDLVDEALKALGYEQRMTKILGGVYSDQKICKTCPHRYSREQQFSVISVDIKNFSNLTDSLHEYVKGELLDGSNAYYCERCDKKVDTIKRLCVKKLPPILVIQLKRFDYDYERECAIKFNDYFEFPRDLDMEPYTVAGLAKVEGEAVDCDPLDLDEERAEERKYRLRGMVVHSGQASGGHYYSYIQSRDADGQPAWYKFDDGDVSEIKMEDDEELKAQCYGGEYMSEVFDPMLKRMSYRKQKRWWNAYMLFYTRADVDDADINGIGGRDIMELMASQLEKIKLDSGNSIKSAVSGGSSATTEQRSLSKVQLKIPLPIEKSIQKHNVRFLHHRNQYSMEFFQFMRKIISCNLQYVTSSQPSAAAGPASEKLHGQNPEVEELALVTVQLASRFLFTSGFRTKKSLRGPAQEWYEILTQHLRYSRTVRLWFCQKVLFVQPARFCEYILECPSAEVRNAFVRIIVYVAHFSLNDGPCPAPAILQQQAPMGHTLSDHLLQTVLALLWMEVSEHGRHLQQYFSLFVMYASLGYAEKKQLLKLNVPATFIQVALDEGPGPPIKYQYAELAKLYQVVAQLVRCCDVSSLCQSSEEGKDVLPNPYIESSCPVAAMTTSSAGGSPKQQQQLMPIQQQVAELVYQRLGYLKKLIEEAISQDDTRKLLMFCCWENPTFSHAVLYELLWQITIAYTHELRPYLDMLFHILMMEDSWQSARILKSFKGIPDDHSAREGLFDTIFRSKAHYQKRSYQCIKLLVNLFTQCAMAKNLLYTSDDLKRKWAYAVEWLSEELERGRGGGGNAAGGGGNAAGGQQGQQQGGQQQSSQYAYTNWSPPAQSNEGINGYFLERSHSARLTLEKACELLPDEVLDSAEAEGDDAMDEHEDVDQQQQQQRNVSNSSTTAAASAAPSSSSASTSTSQSSPSSTVLTTPSSTTTTTPSSVVEMTGIGGSNKNDAKE